MKKIIAVLVLACTLNISQAFAGGFEGIVVQKVNDIDKGTLIMKWFFKGEELKLQVVANNETFSFVAKPEGLLIYTTAQGEDGGYYYSVINPSYMSSSLKTVNSTKNNQNVDLKGLTCNKISLNGEVNGSVLFAPAIDVSSAYLFKYFQNSYGLKALAELNLNGFPLQSSIYEEGKLIFSSELVSYEETTVSETEFNAPSNYKNSPVGE